MQHVVVSLKKYSLLIIICFIFIIVLLIVFLVSNVGKRNSISYQRNSSQQIPNASAVPVTSKVWQISFSYNPKKQQLTMKRITIMKGTAHAAPASNSPYTLLIYDKNNQVLFKTEITIAQQILYDVYFPPGSTTSGLPQLENLDSLVTVPYFADGQVIAVQKNGQELLRFSPPKEISFFKIPALIQQAEAATCDLLHIVFISDGYTDMTKFHADAQKAEATFLSKAPFSAHIDIFDFKTVDNPDTNPLGCKTGSSLNVYCLYTDSSLSNISSTVFNAYPQLPQDSTYTKIVVLVDGSPEPFTGGGLILGVANSIGGQFGVFQDQLYFESTATMEVLGHDVGQLYDRYIYPPQPGSASDMGNTIPAPYASNCSTNPQGESFWRSAGVTTAYKGCTSQYMYAPAPLDCSNGGGSTTTIMSAAGCAGPQFDGVEQYYLQSVIMPRYCKFVPTSTPSPTSTMTPTPSVSPTSPPGADSTIPSTGSIPQNTTPASKPSQAFKCELDPKCSNSKNNLQMCQLICTPI